MSGSFREAELEDDMQFHSHFLPGVHLGSSPALQKSNSAKHTQSVSLVFVNDWPGQHDCEAYVGWVGG